MLIKNKNSNIVLQMGLCNTIIGSLINNYPFSKDNSKSNNIAIDIINFIEQNFKNQLNLKIISSYFGYNTNYFSKLFNHLFNCSLTDYINYIRFNYVKKNKEKYSGSLLKLVFEAGFESLSTFYRYQNKQKIKIS